MMTQLHLQTIGRLLPHLLLQDQSLGPSHFRLPEAAGQGLGFGSPGFKFQLYQSLLRAEPCARCVTSLTFRFLIYELGMAPPADQTCLSELLRGCNMMHMKMSRSTPGM